MSNFKVSKEKIALFVHPNADKLQLGRVGSYQVVVQKGLYQDGDEVIFAPEKSVLTGQLKLEYEQYLAGPNKDRVKSVRLRDQISSGIIIPPHLIPDFDSILPGEDVSEKLGITKYEPPKNGLTIEESDENTYWIAAKNDNIVDRIRKNFTTGVVQIFGEVIPVQGGYGYGQTKPTSRLFDVRHNGDSIPYDVVAEDFKNLWVPVVFDGVINLDKKEVIIYSDPEKDIHKTRIDYLLPKSIVNLCTGNELVSGKQGHIREGVVLRPYIDRNAVDGTKLRLKIINPAYRETGEEIN